MKHHKLSFVVIYNQLISNENENESLLIPAVQHDIYHCINVKNKIDLRIT